MQNNLISIAMTTYNGEAFLAKQLDSIINQTYKNIEIIICDDCSIDKTTNIIQKYVRNHPFIHLYKNETNLGFAKNFEKAISLCKGEYIVFADQDDIWLESKIEKLVNNIEDNSVIFSKYKNIDELDDVIYENPPLWKEVETRFKECNYDFRNIICFNNFVTGCTMMSKKDFVLQYLPIPDGIYHDWWFAYIAAKKQKLKYINEPLILYRLHTNNETAKNRITNKNNRELSKLKKIFSIIFNKEYLIKKNNNIDKIIKFLKTINNTNIIDEYEKKHNAQIISMYESIKAPKTCKNSISLLKFEYKNRKYISSKKGYFVFSVLTRIMNLIIW